MRLLAALLLVAACASHVCGEEAMSFIEMDPMALFVDEPHQCCRANAVGGCTGVDEFMCNSDGVCFCCPNPGGINITESGDCTCVSPQTCNVEKCKNYACGEHGTCYTDVRNRAHCACDKGWITQPGGAQCGTSVFCCSSPFASNGSSLCQEVGKEVCVDGTCFCCPTKASDGTETPSYNATTGVCVCDFEPTCAVPPPPPCQGIHCGAHAGCVDGVCECIDPWDPNSLDPATNSCSLLKCSPPCAFNGACNNGTCDCSNGFDGDSCSVFTGYQPYPPAGVGTNGVPTNAHSIVIYSLLIPGIVLVAGALLFFFVNLYKGSTAAPMSHSSPSAYHDMGKADAL